jgi:uncharacterized RDD family membrane protein YckC
MLPADWDEDLSILSAENVHFGVETAGLGSRLAAIAIDVTLQLVALTLFVLALNYLSGAVPDWSVFSKGVRSGFAGLGILTAFLILYGYYFFFEWLWDGQTPGKRWTGLRVLQTDGSPVTFWPALVRNLLRVVDFLPLCYGIGAVTAILNPQNRRAGDLVAGTLVAREKRESAAAVLDIGDAAQAFLASLGAAPIPEYSAANGAPIAPTSARAATTVDPAAAALRARLNEQEYELARDFLRRRTQLAPAARERLARTVAARLAARLGEAAPRNAPEAERMLETVTELWRRGPES